MVNQKSSIKNLVGSYAPRPMAKIISRKWNSKLPSTIKRLIQSQVDFFDLKSQTILSAQAKDY